MYSLYSKKVLEPCESEGLQVKLGRPSYSLSLAGHVASDITSLYLLSTVRLLAVFAVWA